MFESAGIIGASIVSILLFLSIFGIIGSFCWPYVLNTWLVFFGKTAVVLWWHGFLLGYVPWVGQASLPAAVITWILMMFIG
jgi:hypothetical protein